MLSKRTSNINTRVISDVVKYFIDANFKFWHLPFNINGKASVKP